MIIYSPNGLMRYNDSVAIVDDMPLLSQWIKKALVQENECFLEASPGFDPGNNGFADRGLTAWL